MRFSPGSRELFGDGGVATRKEGGMTEQAVFTFTDPAMPEAAKRRLGGQNALVLELLRKGAVTNAQLEDVCGRVNSRIADVRRFLRETEGRTIETKAIDVSRGLYQYEIS